MALSFGSFTVRTPSHSLFSRSSSGSQSSAVSKASQTFSGDRLDDLRVNFELYGKVIPVVYGNGKSVAETLYARDIEEVTITTSSGGKGGGKKTSSSESSYFGTRIMSFGRKRPGSVIRKLWMNKRLVYDSTSTTNPSILEGLVFRFHPGGPTETVDPILLEDKAADAVLAYNHLCTLGIENMPLGSFNNAWPYLIEAEILDNHSALSSHQVFTELPGTDPDTEMVFDWARGIGWTIDHTGSDNLIEYRISDTTQTAVLPIDATIADAITGGFTANAGIIVYMPAVNRIFGAGSAGSTPNGMSSWILDPDTGITTAGEFISNSPGRRYTEYNYLEVTTLFGVTETYLFGFLDSGKLDVMFIEPAEITEIHSFDPGTAPASMTRGPQSLDQSIMFVVWEDTVYEYTVNSGATIDGGVASSVVYTASGNVSLAHYDAADGGIVLWLSDDSIIKILVSDWSTILWTSTRPGGSLRPLYGDRIVTRVAFSDHDDDEIFVLDITTGIYTVEVPVTLLGTNERRWDDLTSSFFQWNSSRTIMSRSAIGAVGDSNMLLRDALSSMMLANGYVAADFDFSAVTDTIQNLTIAEDTDVDTVLWNISQMFGLELLDLEKIYLIPIPADGDLSSTVTIEHDWMVKTGEEAVAEFADEDDIESPRAVEVTWLDPEQNGAFNTVVPALASFPATHTVGTGTARLRAPVGMSVTQATTLGFQFLNRRQVERHPIDVTLGLRNLAVRPADPITVEVNGISYLSRVARQTLDPATMTMDSSLVVMVQQQTGDVTGAVGIGRPETVASSSPTELIAINGPLLRGTLDQGGLALLVYVIMTEQQNGGAWRGATALMSVDGQTTWREVARTNVAATRGKILTPPPAPITPYSTDYVNSIKVRLLSGDESDLTSITYAQALAGGNACLIGSDGRWEVIKVETWTDNGDETFTGTGLHRAHLGTDHNTGGHLANDEFIVLDEGDIHAVVVGLSSLNQTIHFRAVGHDSSFETSTVVPFTVTGRAETPNAAPFGSLEAVINGVDIDLDWDRSTRGDGAWLDGVDTVPLLEAAEEYEIDIKDGPGGTVVGTYGLSPKITTSAYTYLEADIISDLGAVPDPGDSFTYETFQISAIIGRGIGREATITL